MSRWHGRHEECPHCGLVYERFTTGYAYSEVRMLLWVGTEDQTEWKYKRRHTVLGMWHSIKVLMWDEHIEECEQQKMWEEAQAQLGSELKELCDVLLEMEDDEVPF